MMDGWINETDLMMSDPVQISEWASDVRGGGGADAAGGGGGGGASAHAHSCLQHPSVTSFVSSTSFRAAAQDTQHGEQHLIIILINNHLQ